MTYIPVRDSGDRTVGDQARFGALAYNQADLNEHLSMIREKWLHYPEVQYQMIVKSPTGVAEPVTTDPGTPLSGDTATTKFDPLWNEAVPADPATDGKWVNPHGPAATVKASNPEVYADPTPLRARIYRKALATQLKKWGFDEFRDLVVCIPTILLDDASVTCSEGDIFEWDNEKYQVLKYVMQGYWFNTNIRLYMILNCQHYRVGS